LRSPSPSLSFFVGSPFLLLSFFFFFVGEIGREDGAVQRQTMRARAPPPFPFFSVASFFFLSSLSLSQRVGFAMPVSRRRSFSVSFSALLFPSSSPYCCPAERQRLKCHPSLSFPPLLFTCSLSLFLFLFPPVPVGHRHETPGGSWRHAPSFPFPSPAELVDER